MQVDPDLHCVCGHAAAEHDTESSPVDWPCLARGCECDNFDEDDQP